MKTKFRAWDGYNHKWMDPRAFNIKMNSGEMQRNSSAGIISGVEIEQFTGLLDKNGKEIYEGDVVKVLSSPSASDIPLKITFEDGAFCFYDKSPPAREYPSVSINRAKFEAWNGGHEFIVEVIGNIHKNPTLIN